MWLPFSANRDYYKDPRIITKASGHYYTNSDGEQIYDSFSGLWTNGFGHCHPKLVAAVTEQAQKLDYSMSFQMANNVALELANQLIELAPKSFKSCFFTNSGSEAADTALKIALGYHYSRGDSSRSILIGRARGYHGTNFGGTSVGCIDNNRQAFMGNLLPNVLHLPHTWDPENMAFSRGQPQWGKHLADELLVLIKNSGAENIAAVMVEPVAGSTGVLVPPIGYLERLREICTEHDILLIFDEVITALGRVGYGFAAERFQVIPDIITTAKGITNGMVPMGAVLVSSRIYDTYMQCAKQPIELFHGYTYSGHPIAAAAGLASMQVLREENIFAQAQKLEPIFQEAIHTLDHHPKVLDVRNFGMMGAIELKSNVVPGSRGMQVFLDCYHKHQLLIRSSGDILQFSPFLNSLAEDIEKTFNILKTTIDSID